MGVRIKPKNQNSKSMLGLEIAGLALGGVSTLAGIFGIGKGNSSNSNVNWDLWHDQKLYNTEEAEKARQFERDEWTRRFNLESEYNTPKNQLARLAETGLNAQSLYGDSGNAGEIFGMSSAPSAPQASAGNPPYQQQTMPNSLDELNAFGSLLEKASAAFKNTNEGNRIRKLLAGDIEFQSLTNGIAKQKLIADTLTNAVNKSTQLKKAMNELRLQEGELMLQGLTGDKIESETFLNKCRELNEIAMRELHGYELQQWEALFPTYILQAKANLRLTNAQTKEANANANMGNAYANESAARREGILSDNVIKAINAEASKEAKVEIIKSTLEDAKAKGAVSERQFAAMQIEIKRLATLAAANDKESWRKFDVALEHLFDLLGLHTSVSISE